MGNAASLNRGPSFVQSPPASTPNGMQTPTKPDQAEGPLLVSPDRRFLSAAIFVD